jgi:prepilin-type N-terminal cleavage/methylation domain-containing protein
MKKKLNKKGFTLVELIVVIVIVAILAAIAIPAVMAQVNNARDNTAIANARSAWAVILMEHLQGDGTRRDANGEVAANGILPRGPFNTREASGSGDTAIAARNGPNDAVTFFREAKTIDAFNHMVPGLIVATGLRWADGNLSVFAHPAGTANTAAAIGTDFFYDTGAPNNRRVWMDANGEYHALRY